MVVDILKYVRHPLRSVTIIQMGTGRKIKPLHLNMLGRLLYFFIHYYLILELEVVRQQQSLSLMVNNEMTFLKTYQTFKMILLLPRK